MLYALIVNILYKQQINRTFIERDKKNINKKSEKKVSNTQNVRKFKNRSIWV